MTKKFTAVTSYWKIGKALTFFLNFIRNHDGYVNDNDAFDLVASLRSDEEWNELIHNVFPDRTLARLEAARRRQDCLDFTDETKEMIREIWCSAFARKRLCKLLSDVVNAELAAHPLEKYTDEPFAQKVTELQQTLKLSDFETDVLLVLAFVSNNLLCIIDGHNRRTDAVDKLAFIAKNLDCDVSQVRYALGEKEKLRRYCCVDDDLDFNDRIAMFLNGVTAEPLASSYYVRCRDEVLPWEFYGAVAEKHGALLKRIISAAGGKTATNILLYGAPGTGKTSFAKTLAAELHRDCYLIQQNIRGDGRTVQPAPARRFGALQLCAERLAPDDSIIIVDEADDMLRGGDAAPFGLSPVGAQTIGDKGLLNSVLDSVKVPTIWITNTPAWALDESSRRRFDYSIRFEPLTAGQRQSIWHNNVVKMQLEHLVDERLQEKFAALYPVSAGGITLTLQNLAKLAPQPAEVEELVEKLLAPHCELLGVTRTAGRLLPARDYSLEGLNIKGPLGLNGVIQAVRNFQQGRADGIDRPRMNLLLSGAPGTGKTEFVKYLGSVLGSKIVVKMGSDLLDMYLGGTEQNIRRAFEEAAAEYAILFLDEIDGMLQSRELAQRRWEVTQVNELLYQMENFDGVMIGATNFSANLDSAVLRRFTFKLEFDYLDEAGKKIFFERMFQSKLTAEEARELAAIPQLAPGDFRTVRQSLFYLDNGGDNAARLAALARESEVKQRGRGAAKMKVGF